MDPAFNGQFNMADPAMMQYPQQSQQLLLAQLQQAEQDMYAQDDLDRETPLKRYSKWILWINILLALIWSFIGLMAILHPVPLFGKTNILMSIQAASSAQYSRRSLDYGSLEVRPNLSERNLPHESTASSTWRILSPSHSTKTAWIRSSVKNDTTTKLDDARFAKRTVLTMYSMKTMMAQSTPSDLISDAFSTRTTNHISVTTVASSRPSKPAASEGDEFVALWYGVMGICLQRSTGVLLCSGSSISPDFSGTYAVSRLNEAEIATLPKGTSGAATAIVLGMVSVAIASLFNYATLKPQTFIYILFLEARRENWLILRKTTVYGAAVMAAFVLVLNLTSALNIRKEYTNVDATLNALRPDLTVELGNVMSTIFSLAIISGIMLLTLLVLVGIVRKLFVRSYIPANIIQQELIAEKLRDKEMRHKEAIARLQGSSMGGSRTPGSGERR